MSRRLRRHVRPVIHLQFDLQTTLLSTRTRSGKPSKFIPVFLSSKRAHYTCWQYGWEAQGTRSKIQARHSVFSTWSIVIPSRFAGLLDSFTTDPFERTSRYIVLCPSTPAQPHVLHYKQQPCFVFSPYPYHRSHTQTTNISSVPPECPFCAGTTRFNSAWQ